MIITCLYTILINVLYHKISTKHCSVSIRGMESEILGRFPNHVRPESMTMDWIGGQIFFTESLGYQIEAASVRGNGDETLAIGSVMSSYGVDSGLVTPHQPKDVLFDEKNT